jgi:hypothetical protein
MSEVISFRLDRDNPREAQALAVLRRGQEAGYSVRHILTEALLALEAAAEEERAVATALTEVAGRLEQVQSVLERFQRMDLAPVQRQDGQPEGAALSEAFVVSVKGAARPGLALGRD